MSGQFLYQWVLATAPADRMDAVRALNDASLCRLSGLLGREYDENETTGEVLGMCIVEQAVRFVRATVERGLEVPATLEKEGGKIQ